MTGRPKKNNSFCLENKPIIILVNDIIAKDYQWEILYNWKYTTNTIISLIIIV